MGKDVGNEDLRTCSKPGATPCWKAPRCSFVGKCTNTKRMFAKWAKKLSVGWKDRAWHKMHTLIDIIYQAGGCDQLDMGAPACMELVSRRLQQHTEAYAHGADASNWASARHFSGSSTSLDLEMQSYASRLGREGGSRQRSKGTCSVPQLRHLPAWSSGGLTGGQRRRLLRDVNGACRALSWMHGEENLPAAPSFSCGQRGQEPMSSCGRAAARQPGGSALG